MDMFLPKFDIYQGAVSPKRFQNHKNSWFFVKKNCLMSGLKFTLSHVTSFLPDILSGLKKLYSGQYIEKREMFGYRRYI